MTDLRSLLRVGPGPVRLADIDPESTPAFDGEKSDGREAMAALDTEIDDLQARLAANGYTGGDQRVLLVVQGMDTSGKGGVLKHVIGLIDPGGVRIKGFKAPTDEEKAHDFLWRIEREVPSAGQIGIFDRSHYEDVLIVKVHEWADAAEIERRYEAINDFERRLHEQGTTIIKCMLHISADEQRERLLARLDDPTKMWKFKPADVDERQLWSTYQDAYEVALSRCSTEVAPWYVIPSNRKWYRTWAIATLLKESLAAMDLDWPAPDYDVEEQKARLNAG